MSSLRSRLIVGLSILLVVPLAGASAASGAELVGTASPWWTGSFSTISVAPAQTVFNLTDPTPGTQLASPIDGVIVRWRTEEFSGLAEVQLQVIRPAGGGRFGIVESGPVQRRVDTLSTGTGSGTRYTWPARIPIRAGDLLALHQANPLFSFFFGGQENGTGTTGKLEGVGVGAAAAVPDAWMTAGNAIGLNADVEPDADGDGWGDESQDACPGLANQDQTDTDADGDGDLCDADDDGDGLDDADEPGHGTDPLDSDTDGDSLNDGDEVAGGTDPARADSDGDGLDDAVELAIGTDPLVADSDGDGVEDGADGCPAADGRGAADGCAGSLTVVDTVLVPIPPPAPQQLTLAFVQPGKPLKLLRPHGVEVDLEVAGPLGAGGVDLLHGSDVICHWDAGPFRCTWTPDGGSVGRRTLVASARTQDGRLVVARRTVRVGRFRPAGLRARTTIAHVDGAMRVETTGRLRLPARVARQHGCRGPVVVRVMRGRKHLAVRRAQLDGRCRFSAAIDFAELVAPGDRLRVQTTFEGNAVLTRKRVRAKGAVVPSAASLRARPVPAGATSAWSGGQQRIRRSAAG